MAGETGTQGATGSEFPVFKSESGAFDRAKYQEQSSELVKDGQLTGKVIDEDLRKQKGSIDKVVSSAINFYDESFDKNIKEIDPAIDTKSIYYTEAYSDGGSHTSKIRRKIESGESVDGKEIFEMAKDSAKNKIGNMTTLKKGTVTEIVENLGFKNIKDFDLYDDVKSDFDSKVKDEKLNFDSFIKKFGTLLTAFNDKGPMAGQNSSLLYTPENNAFISALAKILEGEGFANDSIVNMSKKYDENVKKLSEKTESLESKKMNSEGEVSAATGTVSETKLEEKTTGNATGAATGAAELKGTTEELKETKTTAVESSGVTGASVATGTTSMTGSTATTAENKLAEAKTETPKTDQNQGTNNKTEVKTEAPKLESSVESNLNSRIKDLLGIDLNGISTKNLSATGGTGGTGGTNTSVGTTDSAKLIEARAKEMGLIQEEKADKGTSTVETKTEETKLEAKTESNIKANNETLSPINSKIETTTQNLASVATPTETNKESESTNTTNTSTNTSTASTDTQGTEIKSSEPSLSESNTNIGKTETKIEENKNNAEENKEMLNTMKSVEALLMKLNSTMQGPLIVTPTNKKFQ